MKTSMTLLFLSLSLLATICLGQITWTNTMASKAGEATISDAMEGTLLTISTENGFSWLISDALASDYDVYATLICVSTGSTTDTGVVQRVEGGYPSSYSVQSQVLPVFGKNFPNLDSDTTAFYGPSKPTRGVALSHSMSDITYLAGSTIRFQQTSSSLTITLNGQNTYPIDMTGMNYGLGFELINCGTAVWCIQDATQYSLNPMDCNLGNAAPTCPVSTTCSSPQYKTDCSSASTFYIKDYSCLTQCPSSNPAVSVQTDVYACTPSSSGATKSQGWATWKLGLAISLPIVGLALFIFIIAGIRAFYRGRQKEESKKFAQIPAHPTSPAAETFHTRI